jgi:hypothetical protein
VTPLSWFLLAVVVCGVASAVTATDHVPQEGNMGRRVRVFVFHALFWSALGYAFLIDFGRVYVIAESHLWLMWAGVLAVQQAALAIWRAE